jgi:aldehyde:ferredoxin oxidoreductase
MSFYGYTGKILNIDLATKSILSFQENIEDLKLFLGGFGVNCKLFAEMSNSSTDPFSPENPIIIGTGPLVGTITPGASRTVVITKFPATRAIANSCGSMSFAFNLKQAGYDHIIITGRADRPTYLFINNDKIELLDATNLWGKDIVDTTNSLNLRYQSCGIIAIGQSGEKMIKSSLTLIDKTSTLGRGGLGAVFGSKKLKAIVIKGNKGLKIADPRLFNVTYKKLRERIRLYPQRESWIELGMLRSLPIGMFLSAKGQKGKARQCSERNYLKKMKVRRIACPSCPMGDKDILQIDNNKLNYTSSVINPLMMFNLDGLESYDQSLELFDIINRYGLDALTITAYIDFINRMYAQDLLSNLDIGFEWKQNFESYVKLINLIINKKGIGIILADGWDRFVSINSTFKDKMTVIKGLDVIFEPRFLKLGTMEFEQVVNPKGAHVASGGSPTYVGAGGSIDKMKRHFNRMAIPNLAIERILTPPREEMGINVGRLTRYSEDWYTLLTSLGLCARAQMNRFYNIDLITELYNSVTGLNLTIEDLRKSAERSWNLLKLLNTKEGFSRLDDKFPKEWFNHLNMGENSLKLQDFYGTTEITEKIANQLLDDYYDERGWSIETGIPSSAKINELGLKDYI